MKAKLAALKECLLNGNNEDANRPLVYPIFRGFFGKHFLVESAAQGADGYVEGKLLVELKTSNNEWLRGLYQGLHYQKLGLSFPNICVIANRFIGLWKVSALPKTVLELAAKADSQLPPNKVGRINANKTKKATRAAILNTSTFLLQKDDLAGLFAKDVNVMLKGFIYALRNLDKARVQINLYNFIDHINLLQQFFKNPLDAIHCFYAIVGYWTVTSKVLPVGEADKFVVEDMGRERGSEPIVIAPQYQDGFKRFVESHYIFTNEGSGITFDNYFSRFDEVITRLNPDYARQHGILFTDHNLSKFAMWFVHNRTKRI